MTPQATYHDRSLVVPRSHVVKTAWVATSRVHLAHPAPMAVGDVDRAFQRVLHRGPENGGWPPPVGYWDGETFILTDGRHEYLATLMHGQRELFVAWVEEQA